MCLCRVALLGLRTLVLSCMNAACVCTPLQANATSFYVADLQHRTGSVGLLSAGSGWFDDIAISTSCDGGSTCFNAQDGVRCSYTCAPGYIYVSGDSERICQDGAWSGSEVVCSILPPVFLDQTVSVYEVCALVASPSVSNNRLLMWTPLFCCIFHCVHL